MVKICVLLLAAIATLANGQSGGGEDNSGWSGTEKQITGKKCGQLTPDNCKFIDEAIINCPQTCQQKASQQEPPPSNNQNQNPNQPPKKKGLGGLGCFHGDVTVQTKDNGQITMSQLAEMRQDVQVLTRNDQGQLEYAPIRYWLHARPDTVAKYLTLQTQSGHQLTLTGDHLIYETQCQGGQGRAITAKNVQLGRCIYVNDNGRLRETPVMEKSSEKLVGIYAPITSTGSIVVNDVLASCFVVVENEPLQKFVYQLVINAQEMLANVLPSSIYQAAFSCRNGVLATLPRLVFNFNQLSSIFLR